MDLRYEHKFYKSHFACFTCRKVFRHVLPRQFGQTSQDRWSETPACPECNTPMANMGKAFKAPKQHDIKQWRKVELLYRNGYRFVIYSSGPGPRPKQLNEVPAFLTRMESAKKECERQSRVSVRAHELARKCKLRARAMQAKIVARQSRDLVEGE